MKNNCRTKEQTFLCDSRYDIAVYKLKKEPRYDILRGLDLEELKAKAEEFRITVCKELMKLMASSAENDYSFGTLEEIADKLGQDGFTSIIHKQQLHKGKQGTEQPIVVRNEYSQEIWLNIGPNMSQYFARLAFDILNRNCQIGHEEKRLMIEKYLDRLRFFRPKEKNERLYIYGYETVELGIRHANYEVVRYWSENEGYMTDYVDVDMILARKKVRVECGDIIAVRKKDYSHIVKTYFVCKDGHYEEINDFVHDPIEQTVRIMKDDAECAKRRIDNELFRKIQDLEEKTANNYSSAYLSDESKEVRNGNYYIFIPEELPF